MKKLLLFTIMLSVFGCAAYQPPKTYNFAKDMTYEKSFDDIWNKMIEWFATQGTPIKNMDKNSGFISTEYNLRANQTDCLDCGTAAKGGLLAQQNIINPTGNFNVLIKRISDTQTKVSINCFFKATNQFTVLRETQVSTIDCNSTGVLEKQIFDYLGM